MRIYHIRPLIGGVLCLALAVVCLTLALGEGGVRYWIGLGLLCALGGVNFWFALSPKGLEEEMGIRVDERAAFIAAKSAHRAIQVVNSLILLSAVAAFAVYGLTRDGVWLAAGVTLCAVVTVLFFTLLACNFYYERKY